MFSTDLNPVTGLYDQLPDADLGNTFSKTTYKISARWLPIKELLVRGSYGTGFRAPAMTDIAGALVFAGSTTGSYACPFPGTPGCRPGSAQYDLLAGPNGLSGDNGLKPETSKQWTRRCALGPDQGPFDRRRSVERRDQEPGAVARHCRTGRFPESATVRGACSSTVRGPCRVYDHRVRAAAVQRRHREVSGHRLRRHLLNSNVLGRFLRELDGHPYDQGEVLCSVPASRSTPIWEVRTGPAGRIQEYDAADPEPADRPVDQLADGPLQVGLRGCGLRRRRDHLPGEPGWIPRRVGRVVRECGVPYTTWDWQTVYNFNKDIRGRSASSTCSIATRHGRCKPAAAETRSATTGGTPTRSVARSTGESASSSDRRVARCARTVRRTAAVAGPDEARRAAIHPSPKACWIAAR